MRLVYRRVAGVRACQRFGQASPSAPGYLVFPARAGLQQRDSQRLKIIPSGIRGNAMCADVASRGGPEDADSPKVLLSDFDCSGYSLP